MNTYPIVVLLSGNGSNLQAIIDAIAADHLHAHICAVISDHDDAFGLQRAKRANIPTEILQMKDDKNFKDRETYDRALLEIINHYQPQLIILAGFMRILTPIIVKAYENRMLNIHPSLLPHYPGLHTHQRVIDANDHEHGVSIHLVTEELDAGPVVTQARFNVMPNETVDTLEQRVHQLEHVLYPKVIGWFAENRIRVMPAGIYLDDQLLPENGKQFTEEILLREKKPC